MECSMKRKLDCIADMDVIIHPDDDPRDFEEHTKRMRLSVQLSAAVPMSDGRSDCSPTASQFGCWDWRGSQSGSCGPSDRQQTAIMSGMDTDDKADLQDDIPSTSEVINSLRKVILWMGAQGDHNEDYIQYLSEVEKYAKSKQFDIAQQRKITQYLIRRNQ